MIVIVISPIPGMYKLVHLTCTCTLQGKEEEDDEEEKEGSEEEEEGQENVSTVHTHSMYSTYIFIFCRPV